MKHRDSILDLYKQGKSRTEIQQILGCSKSTISFHLSQGQKEKNNARQIKNRKLQHPFQRKLEAFLSNKDLNPKSKSELEIETIIYKKIHTFMRDRKTNTMETNKFTIQDILSKFGENPICYLTGTPIDIYEPSSYEFDHIVPRSKGGSNTLDNLGICTKDANRAKQDMYLDEFIQLCKSVAANHR